ncbi:hypothetical protein [Pseudomonas putida]|uniref:hypothetical protein n=1 Tax=Pseudomonas putida TaxID=303 RepID=UPI003D988A25
MIRINQPAVLRVVSKKSFDKFLIACYVLNSSDEVLCPRHFSFTRALYAQSAGQLFRLFKRVVGDSKWTTIKKNCSSTRHLNWTRWSQPKTPLSSDTSSVQLQADCL